MSNLLFRVEIESWAQLRAPAWVRTGLVRGNEEVVSDLSKGGKIAGNYVAELG
jgi:hypothetical protein